MNDLINILNKDGQLVVTSRQIAEDFEKEHRNVVRDIENLMSNVGAAQNCAHLFIESKYLNKQNKQWYREYLLTRDGFSLLVMGFTGAKALQWKLKYIEAFNKMEQILRGQTKELSTREMLRLQFTYTEELDNRISKLENNMTIDYAQQEELNSLAKKVVVRALGGYGTPAYKELNKKAFSTIWRDYKRVMQVNSYKNTAVKQIEKGKELLTNWKPNRELELMIKGANSQLSYEEVM